MGHLSEPSDGAVRRVLADLAPELVDSPIDIKPNINVRPHWHRTSCMIGETHVLKICWSSEAEAPLRRQARLLGILAGYDERLPTPVPVAFSDDPVVLLYRLIPGRALTHDDAGNLNTPERRALAGELARALVALHAPATLELCVDAGIALGGPSPQASTAVLRERLVPRLDGRLAAWLRACLDWVDATIPGTSPAVVLHGDFHGHNLVLDEAGHLCGVLDLEETSLGPAEYDLRYLPRQAPTLELFDDVADAYQTHAGRPLDTDAVFAWHVLTDLGDALWRTETGVEVIAGPIERRTADLADLLDTRHLPRTR